MGDDWNQALYDERMAEMRAREGWFTQDVIDQAKRNTARLAAYKAKRTELGYWFP